MEEGPMSPEACVQAVTVAPEPDGDIDPVSISGQSVCESGESSTEQERTQQDQSLAEDLSRLSVEGTEKTVLVCDAGYGFPSEARPRREKILAVAKQLCNFIQWQVAQKDKKKRYASVKIVVSCKEDRIALDSRLKELWCTKELPDHVEFVNSDDASMEGVYLSPDSPHVMSPSLRPPPVVIVGMLIDRRVQPNRSLKRANKLGSSSARWPLEACAGSIHPNEPLNIDVVLEGMQQWWWNVDESEGKSGDSAFVQAATQALQRHYERHPNRPLHKSNEKG